MLGLARRLMVSILGLSVLLSGHPASAAGLPLAYKWKAGSVLKYKLKADLKGSLPLFGNPEPVQLEGTLSFGYQAKVLSVKADGSADVALRADSAEAVIAGIPISVPDEDVRKILDQTVTFARTGEVLSRTDVKPLNIGVTIPGVDPQRLYTLLVPIVFPVAPPTANEQWDFKSDLLGAEGTPAPFRATLAGVPAPGAASRLALVASTFHMDVLRRTDVAGKEVSGTEGAVRERKGGIDGTGKTTFDVDRGLMKRSEVKLVARMTDTRLVETTDPNDPKQVAISIDANIVAELLPPPVATPKGKAGTTRKPVRGRA